MNKNERTLTPSRIILALFAVLALALISAWQGSAAQLLPLALTLVLAVVGIMLFNRIEKTFMDTV